MNGHTEVLPPPPPPSDEAPPPPPSDDAPPPPPPADLVPPPPPVDDIEHPQNIISAPKKKVFAAKPKKEPLSIEDIMRKKREEEALKAKPKFLSKAERDRVKFERFQKEQAELQRQIGKVDRNEYDSLERDGPARKYNSNASRNVSFADRSSEVPTGPRAMRAQPPTGPRSSIQHNGRDRSPPPPPRPAAVTAPYGGKAPKGDKPSKSEKRPSDADLEAAEAALIRQRYMGNETNTSTFSAKKKRRRTTEKKFNFEWAAEEDTSNDYNPLYKERAESSLFGRGKLGGFADGAPETTDKYLKQLEKRDQLHGAERAAAILEMDRVRKEQSHRAMLDKHWSQKPLEEMRERDWRIFKEDFNIATKGGSLPNPMRSWKECGLPLQILNIIENVGYDEPSAIQRAAIPIALQSRDLIGVAVTGSGKTAAFLLPLLVYIQDLPPLDASNRADGPYAIVLAPTRELAQQIEAEATKFAAPLGFTVVSIVGGHAIEKNAFDLKNGCEIVIATPGRLVDCIERRVLVLSQCCYIIMDEADRMIDLGFEESVNKILDALPVNNEKPDDEAAENARAMSMILGNGRRYRQTMMYTATMPPAVERIARKYLRRPAQVTIGNVGEAVDTVEQRVEFINGEDKRKKRLEELLRSREFQPPVIVFVNIKRNCDVVGKDIKHMGFNNVVLHGSKTQEQREAALAALRNGHADILVATDLAGRGIDVPDVSLVINFNMPSSIEAYTHRIGRTGRAGKTGISITFLGSEDEDVMYDLKQMLSKSPLSRVSEELRKHPAAQAKAGRGGVKKGTEAITG